MAGFAVCVIILVVLAVWRWDRARKRRAALVATATEREWTYTDADPSLVGVFPGPPFDQGRNPRVTNVVRGRYDGRDLLAFDHTYETTTHTSEGQTTSDHEHSIVGLSIGEVFPSMTISPEGALRRLFNSFFGSDVEIGDPAFDDAFRVSAADPVYARDVLVPEVRAALLRHPDLTWRIERDMVLTIRVGHHDAAEIEPVLQALQAVIAAIPDLVWARVRGSR